MIASEVIEMLKKCPDAKVFIADCMGTPQEANTVLFADEINCDRELSFTEYGIALGEKAVLICWKDPT